MPDPLVIDGLTVSFGAQVVLSNFDLTVLPGETVALIGPSGVGKTTVLNCSIGLVKSERGTVRVMGREITGASRKQLAEIRSRDVGVVFQHGELIGELSPLENVMLPAIIRGIPIKDARKRADELLRLVDVPTDRDSVNVLSGGERQRVALVRALVNRPGLLLADEPTGALDPGIRDLVATELFSLPSRYGLGLLVVTHDPHIARRADRLVQMGSVSPGGDSP